MSVYDGDDDDVVDDDNFAESDGAGDLDDTDVGEVIMAMMLTVTMRLLLL